MNLFFVVFRLFVLLPSSMSKLIHYHCTCKLTIKTTAAYVYANEQLRLCFYVLVLDIHLSKLNYKNYSVNIGEYSPRRDEIE